MPSIDALILGLVQGLTEFLPVSSSGHLVVAAALLGYSPAGLVLEIAVHLATTLVVLVYFRRRFAAVVVGVFNNDDARRLALMLGLSLVATSVVALVLRPAIGAAYLSPGMAGVMWLVTGGVLLSLRFAPTADAPCSLARIPWWVALLVGALQGVAVLPGISRSGLTIAAGLWAGQSRSAAAEFSFLLAAPTVLMASLFSLVQAPDLGSADAGDVLPACGVAFISGLVTIHWLMRWAQSGRLWLFGIYCLLVGGVTVALWGLLP